MNEHMMLALIVGLIAVYVLGALFIAAFIAVDNDPEPLSGRQIALIVVWPCTALAAITIVLHKRFKAEE